jgi:hypothetical protein
VRLAHQTRHRTGTIPTAEVLDALRPHQATLDLILRAVLAQDPRQRSSR